MCKLMCVCSVYSIKQSRLAPIADNIKWKTNIWYQNRVICAIKQSIYLIPKQSIHTFDDYFQNGAHLYIWYQKKSSKQKYMFYQNITLLFMWYKNRAKLEHINVDWPMSQIISVKGGNEEEVIRREIKRRRKWR